MAALVLRRLSDEQLGGRLARGEAAAFDELYRRYVHRLAAYGGQLLGDAAAGEDVAQASLMKAYGALRDGNAPERVRPWLYRIAHNAAVDVLARRRDVPSAELVERPDDRGDGAAGALVAAVAALPDRQRRVYALRELHGLRIDETAAALGLTAAQVEQALFAARNRLAEHLAFGERLDCVAVRRLVSGPLDAQERRALKTHLRSCAGCRVAVGHARVSALPFLDWLRAVPGLLVGGGAPVAAKLGAVAATATVAGVPFAFRDVPHARLLPREPATTTAAAPVRRPHRVPALPHVVSLPQLPVVAAAPTVAPPAAGIVRRPTRPVAAVRLVRARPESRGNPERERARGDGITSEGEHRLHGDAAPPVVVVTSGHGGGHDVPDGEARSPGDGPSPVPATTVAPVTVAAGEDGHAVQRSRGDGGSGDGGSQDGQGGQVTVTVTTLGGSDGGAQGASSSDGSSTGGGQGGGGQGNGPGDGGSSGGDGGGGSG